MRNEPQRTHRHEVAFRRVGHKERNKKLRKFGAASQRNGITLADFTVELTRRLKNTVKIDLVTAVGR